MQSLAILKSDGVFRRAAGAGILKGLVGANLCGFLSFQRFTLPTSLLERHYQHVSTRDFYPWLLEYMSTGPSYVILLEGDPSALSKMRDLLGSTRAHQARPDTLRFRFCPFGGANGLHLSEDEDAAMFETALWKKALGIKPGQFDVPIDKYIDLYVDKPNNALELRELCLEINSAGRPIKQEYMAEMHRLLAEECFDATQSQIEFMVWVLSEGCFLG
jgi:nucleoside-diphosphate kinase